MLRDLLVTTVVCLSVCCNAVAKPVQPLADNPVAVAYQRDNAPASFTNTEGQAAGILIRFWQLWSAQTGHEIEFHGGAWKNPLDALRDSQADTTLALFDPSHASDELIFAEKGLPVPFYIYFHHSIRQLRDLEDLLGFRIGVIQGSSAKRYLLDHLPHATIRVYPTAEALLHAAEAGEIRVFVAPAPVMRYQLENQGLQYDYRFYTRTPLFTRELRPAVRRGQENLLTAINQGLAYISDAQWNALISQWLSKPDDSNRLVIAAPLSYPPLAMLDERGQPTGLLVDIWRLWAKRTGNRIRFELSHWNDAVEMLQQGEAEIHAGVFDELEWTEEMAFSEPLFELESGLFVPVDSDIHTLMELKDKPVGVVQGSFQESWLGEQFPALETVPFVDAEEMINAALQGQLAAFIYEILPTRFLLQRRGRNTHFKILPQVRFRRQLVAAVMEKQQHLVKRIDKGFKNLPLEQLQALERDWIADPKSYYYHTLTDNVLLTLEEHHWLNKYGEIRVGLNPNWPPFIYRGEAGQLQGIVLDYLELLREKLDLNLHFIMEPDGSAVLEAARERQVDLLPGTAATPERRKWLAFTDPYTTFQRVIITRKNAATVNSVEDLQGKVVVVNAGSATHEWLQREFPRLSLRAMSSDLRGLEAVANGHVDAMISNLAVITWLLQAHNFPNLKISTALVGQVDELRLAVRSDWPQLVAILNKGLAAISPEQHNAIWQKWFQLQFSHGVDMAFVWRVVLQVIAGALIILCVVISFSNRRLRREVNERERAQAEVKAQRDVLERLATTDSLTGAWNRRRFMELAEKEINRSQRYGHPLTVVMVDIDHFKQVNDTYGHSAGDLALVQTVTCIHNKLRATDVLGRIGGEEFALLLPETGPSEANQVAERLRQAVSNFEITIDNGTDVLRLTISIGLTQLRKYDRSVDQILSRADQALYRAKGMGRNRVVMYEDDPAINTLSLLFCNFASFTLS